MTPARHETTEYMTYRSPHAHSGGRVGRTTQKLDHIHFGGYRKKLVEKRLVWKRKILPLYIKTDGIYSERGLLWRATDRFYLFAFGRTPSSKS